MTELATIGHNMPPPPTPYEAMLAHVGDLFETAEGFLDGDPIRDQATADLVGQLIDQARTAQKDADAMRKAEAKPFDDGKAAVQARWTPITDDKKGKCALIIATAKRALTPWLTHLDDVQREQAAKARQVAEDARLASIEAHRAANVDLGAAERAEEMERAAAQAQKLANRADKAKPQATGGARSIGLRTSYRAEITDRRLLLNHYAATRPNDLTAWLQEQADGDVRTGARNLPGVDVIEVRTAA